MKLNRIRTRWSRNQRSVCDHEIKDQFQSTRLRLDLHSCCRYLTVYLSHYLTLKIMNRVQKKGNIEKRSTQTYLMWLRNMNQGKIKDQGATSYITMILTGIIHPSLTSWASTSRRSGSMHKSSICRYLNIYLQVFEYIFIYILLVLFVCIVYALCSIFCPFVLPIKR